MKYNLKLCGLGVLAFLLFATTLRAQDTDSADSTGLPGDHFSLEGALELFKKAASPEDFEKLLNAENNNVNNLDLNEDGETDYIRVVDNMDGDVHAIVLQVPVSETESQDVAVIEIEKQGADQAILQILGDEDIFGKQVIVEPFDEEAKSNGRGGPSAEYEMARVVVNVWLWPSVRYVYRPGYTVWVSPWRWSYYPSFWKPWRPRPWHTFYVGARPYRGYYHPVTVHRVVRAHTVYVPRRTSSKVVHTKTTVIKKSPGRKTAVATQKTTTVRGRNGNVQAQRKTTTVKGKNGNVKAKKSTTTVRKKRGRG